ncbi:DUF6090 family protein [Roseivirga sp. 4D4]|uniref:DUF6090 family protein n=1 Tax=Roseivirga sp. 4D4 TaxID=1889784 RepID=UPI001112F10E|nr:DUF6090 family protein [Roseivirga sp. 4D4]
MKSTRYLKYAFGEILLVVIGILIAFQVNNWNEGRKQRIEETKLLQSIKVDFEQTKATLQALNIRREESLSNFKRLIEVRNSGDFSNELHIDTLLAKATFTPTYNGNTSSIAIVINSGKINLLSNDSLKSMLLAWPSQIENLIERELDAKVVTNEEWVPFAQRYTSVNDWFKNYSFPAPSKERESKVSKDYKGLFNDRRFENTITKLELLYIAAKSRTNGLINSTNSIIEIIDEDLENR